MSAKKTAGGMSNANSKAEVKKRLQAATGKLLKKTKDSDARKKGRERMRKLALDFDTEDKGERGGKKSSKKLAGKSRSSQEISWKDPVDDGNSSIEDEDDEGEFEEESDLNVTFNDSPEETNSDEDLDETKEEGSDSSDASDSDEDVVPLGSKNKRQQKKKPKMPLSIMIPKSLWPRGMTKEAIDMLSLPMLEKLQAHDIALRTLEGTKDEKNPGKIVEETAPTMTKVFVQSSYHDFVSKFSPAHFLHFPLSPPAQWWKYVAVAYEEITPEFGHEERGVTGRIARSTWVSAHSRKVR